jgi:hypothetical protein
MIHRLLSSFTHIIHKHRNLHHVSQEDPVPFGVVIPDSIGGSTGLPVQRIGEKFRLSGSMNQMPHDHPSIASLSNTSLSIITIFQRLTESRAKSSASFSVFRSERNLIGCDRWASGLRQIAADGPSSRAKQNLSV